MVEVTTTRPINLGQLSAETGWVFTAADDGVSTRLTCLSPDVTTVALQAAVDAHVAIDEQGNHTTLEEQAAAALDTNRTFLARTSPTNAQVVAQVKALTRQSNGLIRLVLGKLDGTD